jgi:hypothetical protein
MYSHSLRKVVVVGVRADRVDVEDEVEIQRILRGLRVDTDTDAAPMGQPVRIAASARPARSPSPARVPGRVGSAEPPSRLSRSDEPDGVVSQRRGGVMAPRIKQPGRFWAYVGAIGGATVSVAANIAHSYLPPPGAPAGWSPGPVKIAFAVVWPALLFIAFEILSRVRWSRGWRSQMVRFVGMLPVALVAGFVSWRHMSGLLAHLGEEPAICTLGPLAIDGLMLMATAALMIQARTARSYSVTAGLRPA